MKLHSFSIFSRWLPHMKFHSLIPLSDRTFPFPVAISLAVLFIRFFKEERNSKYTSKPALSLLFPPPYCRDTSCLVVSIFHFLQQPDSLSDLLSSVIHFCVLLQLSSSCNFPLVSFFDVLSAVIKKRTTVISYIPSCLIAACYISLNCSW